MDALEFKRTCPSNHTITHYMSGLKITLTLQYNSPKHMVTSGKPTPSALMHLTCIGCRRNFDNRWAYGGHHAHCPEYQALQQVTLSAPESTHLDLTVPTFHDSTSHTNYKLQMSSFLQDKASESLVRTYATWLTIKLLPVCDFLLLHLFFVILIKY